MKKLGNKGTSDPTGEMAMVMVFLIGVVGFVVGYSLLPGGLASIFTGIVGFIAVPLSIFAFLVGIYFVGKLLLFSILSIKSYLDNIEKPYVGSLLTLFILAPFVFYLAICTISLLFVVIPNVYFSFWLIDNLELTGLSSTILVAFNILLGFIGIGVLDAIDSPAI